MYFNSCSFHNFNFNASTLLITSNGKSWNDIIEILAIWKNFNLLKVFDNAFQIILN